MPAVSWQGLLREQPAARVRAPGRAVGEGEPGRPAAGEPDPAAPAWQAASRAISTNAAARAARARMRAGATAAGARRAVGSGPAGAAAVPGAGSEIVVFMREGGRAARLAGCKALAGERGEPAGEPVRFCEVDKVAAVGPLFDLGRREKAAQSLVLVRVQDVPEDGEERGADRRDGVVDAGLEPGRPGAEHLVPVAQDEVLADALPRREAGSFRFGQPVDADALPDRLERRAEVVASHAERQGVGELGERPHEQGLVDNDDAAHRVGGGVDARQGGAHGVAHHHRPDTFPR